MRIHDMTQEQIGQEVVGKHWDDVYRLFDWEHYFPILNSEAVVVGILGAEEATPEGMVYDEGEGLIRLVE